MFMCHSYLQNKTNMHYIVAMPNSQKSLDYHSLLREYCFLSSNKSFLWGLIFPLIILYYFENDFYVRKSYKIFEVFKRFVFDILTQRPFSKY